MVKIEDGTGKGNVARVDSFNRLRTDAVVQPDATFHSRLGQTYAFNSGVLTIPAAMSAGLSSNGRIPTRTSLSSLTESFTIGTVVQPISTEQSPL